MADDTPDIEIGVGEEAVISLPPLMSASDLLPPTTEEIPPTPDASTPSPPGEIVNVFRIEKNRFGAGTWGIDFVHGDGELEPVMIMLQRLHPDWTGGEVASWLTANGLPQEHAVRLGRQRTQAKEGEEAMDAHPAVMAFQAEEAKHYEDKDEFAKAFVQAQAKKEGKR